MVEIDIKDRKILYHLYNNSRQSFTSIGKKVGLSKEIIRYRVKRLQDEGVIQEYNTHIDIRPLGYGAIRFYFTFQFASPEIKKEIIDYFIQSKQTTAIVEYEGTFNLQVGIFLELPDYKGRITSFYEETQRKYRDYFDDQIGTMITFSEVFDCKFLIGKKDPKPPPLLFTAKPPVKVDDLDNKILRILASNARIPTIEIAKELNSTVTTIRKRIQRLNKTGIIMGYSILIDWLKIGYQSFVVEINLKNYNEKYKIMDYVRNNPNLWFIMGSLGHNVDLEFEFVLENVTQLHEIIKDLSTRFPESIKNFKYFSVVKIHKWGAMPQF